MSNGPKRHFVEATLKVYDVQLKQLEKLRVIEAENRLLSEKGSARAERSV